MNVIVRMLRTLRALCPFPTRRGEIVIRVRETITSPVPDEHGHVFSAFGQVCFVCGESVSDPALMWSGFGPVGFIYLHFPGCTRTFRKKLDTELRRAGAEGPQNAA